MKKYTFNYLFLLVALSLVLGSCQKDELVDNTSTTDRTLTLTARMPGNETNLKVAPVQGDGSLDIELHWQEGEPVLIFFRQNDILVSGLPASAQNISADGQSADFTVTLPQDITIDSPYDLYAVSGTVAFHSSNNLSLDASPSTSFRPFNETTVPLYLKLEGIDSEAVSALNGTFKTYGALQVVTIKNTSDVAMTIDIAVPFLSVSLNPLGDYWYYQNQDSTPSYDLLSNIITQSPLLPPAPFFPGNYVVAPGSNIKLAQWVVPNGTIPPAIIMMADINGVFQSTASPMPPRSEPLAVGHAYHLYAQWDGTALSFSDEASTLPDPEPVMTMTTSNLAGSTYFRLAIDADEADQSGVWIDLNYNGLKDSGEEVTDFSTTKQDFPMESTTIAIYGKVTYLDCHDDQLTALDVSSNPALQTLWCSMNDLTTLDVSSNPALQTLECNSNYLTALDVSSNPVLSDLRCHVNQISGSAMDELIAGLPTSGGTIHVIFPTAYSEQNVCTVAQVEAANNRNWIVMTDQYVLYPGS